MADGDITLVSATGDAINLNPLLTSNNGVQVVAGLTGLGLPSVEVMYQVGAGDGAKYRGQRALPRDIDLPLHILGNSRANLRGHVNRLVRALSGECRLQWDDGERVWETKVRRVGGGEYVYGSDTNLYELNLTVTLRAESPLWTGTTPYSLSQTFGTTDPSGGTKFTIPADKFGTSDSRPVIKVTGPTQGFSLWDGARTKKYLEYTAYVTEGDFIEIDMKKGTCVDSKGNNKYGSLAPAPQFFALNADNREFLIYVDRSSVNYNGSSSGFAAQNYITNPTFNSGTTGWTLAKMFPTDGTVLSNTCVYDGTRKAIWFKSHTNTSQGLRPFAYASVSLTLSGVFTPGRRYQIEAYLDQTEASQRPAYAELYIGGLLSAGNIASVATGDGTKRKITYDFICPSPSQASGMELRIMPGVSAQGNPASIVPHVQAQTYVDNVSITEYGYSYFDGDTPDLPDKVYSWNGTAHASISKLSIPADKTKTKLDLSMSAQNWMVV